MNREAMHFFSISNSVSGGRNTAVGIAARYGQVDQGSNPGEGVGGCDSP